jgi:hypothetical protein
MPLIVFFWGWQFHEGFMGHLSEMAASSLLIIRPIAKFCVDCSFVEKRRRLSFEFCEQWRFQVLGIQKTARQDALDLTDRLLQIDRAWKVDVVLEMNMLMQVLLELLQAVIEGVKSRTGICRSGEVSAQTANFSK